MRFENVIISALIAVLAIVVCVMAIGSFSSEYAVPYTDEFSNIQNISNQLYSVSNETYGDAKGFQSSSGTDGWGDAIVVAFKAFSRLDLYLSAVKELIFTASDIIGINPIFALTLITIIIISAAWSIIYLWMRMQPR